MGDNEKVSCEKCGAMILPGTAKKTSGVCMPCFKGKTRVPKNNNKLKKGEKLYLVHIQGKNLKPTDAARNSIVAAKDLKLNSYEFSVTVKKVAHTKDVAKVSSINQVLCDGRLKKMIINDDSDPLKIVNAEVMQIPHPRDMNIPDISQPLDYFIYCDSEQDQMENSWEDSEEDLFEMFAAGEPDKKTYKKLKKLADKEDQEAAERLISHFSEADDENLVSFKEVEKYSLMLAKRNNSMGVGMLAELYADETFEKYDIEEAYFWSFISYFIDGYETRYKNTDAVNDRYMGEVGDFRNEPLVISIVERVGIEKIKTIDAKANEWIKKHLSGSPTI